MPRMTSILCVLVLLSALAGCAGLGASSTPVAELGPADPPTAEARDTAADAELSSGLEWLWSSVVGLKGKLAVVAAVAPQAAAVVEKRLETARELIAHVEAVARQGSVDDAKTLWRQARDAIGTVAHLVQGLAVTSAAGM